MINPEDYLYLVEIIAKKIHKLLPKSVQIEDLISSGYFGLLDAAERFDPRRKTKFETFASQRIRGSILDELRRSDWVPRLVRQKKEKVIHMKNFSDVLHNSIIDEDHGFIIEDELGNQEETIVSPELAEVINKLKPRYREAITLYYFHGWNLRESAEFMKMTESRVCQIIKKALVILRKELEKQNGLPPHPESL